MKTYEESLVMATRAINNLRKQNKGSDEYSNAMYDLYMIESMISFVYDVDTNKVESDAIALMNE